MRPFALVFPGQGSQFVGMGRELPGFSLTTRQLFEEAEDVLGLPLARLCFEGPEGELRRTEVAQPALLTVSFACYQVLHEVSDGRPLSPAALAGHSLGEYTALVVAGALPFGKAVEAVRRRGVLMSQAAQSRPGNMLAVIGLDLEMVERLCHEARAEGVVEVANYNCPGQVVLSGAKDAVALAGRKAKEAGGRAIPLAVSGAFHSALMAPAAEAYAAYLDDLPIVAPRVPVYGNVTGRPLHTPEEVREELKAQLCAPVRWAQSVQAMQADGVELFAEVGPGEVLTGLIRRCQGTCAPAVGGEAAARQFLAILSEV
ncbi:MAG: ACP S-malonyltransferase [Chloroflexi bacterium]|nr:ACP S-malonyltransferase [Chloroflexota bacterium]